MFPWQTDATRDDAPRVPARRLRWGLPLAIAIAGVTALAWLQRDAPSGAALVEQGRKAAGLGRFSEAIGDYTGALSRDPDNPETYRLRASAHMNIANYPAAVADLDTALQLSPRYAQALYDRGVSRWMLERYEAACRDLDAACALEHTRACQQRRSAGCEKFAAREPQ